MAYMSQEKKSQIAVKVKEILRKYKIRGSLSVDRHSTLCLNVRSGPIDFVANCNETCGSDFYQISQGFTPITNNYIQVNVYHYRNHFSGKAKAFLEEVISAMNEGNFDKSDIMTDYFHVGWYVNVNIGKWNKPYIVEA